MLCACSEMSNPQVSNSEDVEKSHSINVVSSTVLSDPSQDPYTVENMSKALRKAALAKSVSAQDSAEVETLSLDANYLYVRFLCKGKEGVRKLKQRDPSLVLFKRPMDYKKVDKSVVYKDETLPEGVIPMFASVPVDYDFGDTEYEVIKELFLVEPLDGEGDEDGRALLKKANGVDKVTSAKMLNLGVSLNEVAWTSLEMTGNLESRLGSEGGEAGSKVKLGWSLGGGGKRYGGQLKFEYGDSEKPLVGVRVTGGYSYYWREAHTDAEGKFTIPEKWTLSIDYEANFDDDNFRLEDGHTGILGENLEIEWNDKKKDWNTTFTGNHAKWCQVWDAAYRSYYPFVDGGYYIGASLPRSGDIAIAVYYKNSGNFDQTHNGYYGFIANRVKVCTRPDLRNPDLCLEYGYKYSITGERLHQRVKDKNPDSITQTTKGLLAFYTYLGSQMDNHKRIPVSVYNNMSNLRDSYAWGD